MSKENFSWKGFKIFLIKKVIIAGCWWLTPIILATQGQRSGGSWFEASQRK
jgi:hypothetical protein